MIWTIAMKRSALALLLAAAVAAVADAQTETHLTGNCTGGLFTLTNASVKFHIVLGDRRSGRDGGVLMRLIDHEGTVVITQTAQLRPGGSATLVYTGSGGSGLYRVQAETFESSRNINFSDRQWVGSMELFEVDNSRTVIPVPCEPN